MKKNYAFILLLFFLQINLFSQDFQWERTFEGSYFSGDNASSIDVDSNENSYTFGMIYETLFDIDPTSGTQIIDNTQSTNQTSLFLTKLDTNGNFLWGKTFGSIFGTMDRVVDIEIGTDGNIYLLADIYEYTTFMQKFITIFKIDPQGNILMIKKMTNLDNPNQYDVFSSSSLALDNQNNIFISGSYKSRLKIDAVNPQLNFNMGGDSFLLKINNTGTIVFGKKFNIGFLNINHERVKIDITQNPVLTVSNGDYPSTGISGYNVFKLSTIDGTIMWQKFLQNQYPETFNIDNVGNIIIGGGGGNVSSGIPIDVDPGPAVSNTPPGRYVLWLTSNGDFLDVKRFPALNGYPYFIFSKIEFDTNNNTYIVGEFINAFDADPSSNSFIINYTCGGSGRDAFYIKLDPSRNFDNAFKLGDYNGNCINFYFTDFKIKNDNQYYVGNFHSTADFDPSPGTFPVTTNNQFGSRFTLKLGPCDITTPVGSAIQSFCSSQNPTVSDLLPNSNSIKWYSSATSTTQLMGNTPLVSGQNYYASRQNGTCPSSAQRLNVAVTINSAPIAPSSSNQVFCESDNATISNLVATGQNIKWYASPTDTSSLPMNTVLQNNTTYYLTQTTNGCESNRASIATTINSVAAPTLTSPQTFCVQQNATLTSVAISGLNIKWYDAATSGNLLPSTTVLANGTNYFASQTISTCESLRAVVLINIQNTATPIGNAMQIFCSSQNPTVNDIDITGSNLSWYSSNSATSPIPVTTPLVNGAIYYTTQTLSNCESVGRLPVTVTLINSLNANDYTETFCDDLNDGSELIDLTNLNSNLISNATNFTFEYYTSLLGATNQSNTNQITSTSNYNLTTGLHTIYIRITSTDGCNQIVKLDLTLIKKPVITIPDTIALCERSHVTIDAGFGFDSYLWSTGAVSQTITVSQDGDYSVMVTENYGSISCSATKNFIVVASNAATISDVEIHDWSDNNNTITVNINGFGNYEFSIDGISYQTSNIFNGLNSGIYTVYVRDINGCGITKQEVYLLDAPKFFTPNGDGYNDNWAIKFSNLEPGLKVIIFDRYGKLLKTLNNSTSWDGKYNGVVLPSNDYWYVVTRKDGKEYRGHFALKR